MSCKAVPTSISCSLPLFFVYGPDNKPTWYTAQLTLDASGNFNGPLIATTGTFYAMPVDPYDLTAPTVGTASFRRRAHIPRSWSTQSHAPGHGGDRHQLVFQRQSLTPIAIGGTYVGGQSGAYSGCSSQQQWRLHRFLQPAGRSDRRGWQRFNFTYGGSLSCTLSGTLTQFGQLYTIPTTAYTCSDVA